MLKYLPAFAVLLAAGPVMAQTNTQVPNVVAPQGGGSASSAPQSANSLPPGAANSSTNTAVTPAPGGNVGTSTGAAPVTTPR